MNKQWAEALNSNSSSISPLSAHIGSLTAYANSDTLQLSDLSSHAIYEVSGSDAREFLQGQFCNDLTAVTSTQAQISGYCTPKGRLLALPTIAGFDGGYRLIVPEDVADAFIKRLSMFIMRSDVTLSRLDDWIALGITTPENGSLDPLADSLGALPAGELSTSTSDSAQLIQWNDCLVNRSVRKRYLRIANVKDQLAIWQSIDQEHSHSGNTWRLADISSGTPSITQGVIEAFVPQMINLQLINALSFTKGCYPGQEIVARMQYLGKLKRHMRIFRVALDMPQHTFDDVLQPGATLCAASDQNAGVIVDAMPESETAALVLAVVKVGVDADTFTLAGSALDTLELPYELPSADDSQETARACPSSPG